MKLNSSYDVVYQVGAANGRVADLHDFTITSEGTALLLVYEETQANLKASGQGATSTMKQAIYDCLFQEVEIETGELKFEWRASEHLHLASSYFPYPSPSQARSEKSPIDWLHLNSVQKDDFGNYLVSARNFHAVLYIDGMTKEIIWTFGGRANDFKDLSGGHALNMAWQHHAVFHPTDGFSDTRQFAHQEDGSVMKLMTIFDNAHDPDFRQYGSAMSRALLVEIKFPRPDLRGTKQALRDAIPSGGTSSSEEEALLEHLSDVDAKKVQDIDSRRSSHTVRLVREYLHPRQIKSVTQGSMQLFPGLQDDDTKVLVGYGNNMVITEFHGNGSVACDMQMAPETSENIRDFMSYRVHKAAWTGKPLEPPSAKVLRKNVFVSWNGATRVRSWLLQAAHQHGNHEWEDVALVPKAGFETMVPLATVKYDVSRLRVRLLAIDNNGQVCEHGISNTTQRFSLRMSVLSAQHLYSGLFILVVGGAGVVVWLYRRLKRRRHFRWIHLSKPSVASSSRVD